MPNYPGRDSLSHSGTLSLQKSVDMAQRHAPCAKKSSKLVSRPPRRSNREDLQIKEPNP